MNLKKLFKSTAARLILAIIIGIVLGFLIVPMSGYAKLVAVQILLIIKQITSQIIFFMVPMIIIGCVAPSITSFKGNATKLLFMTIGVAYLSSILAAMTSIGISYVTVPHFHISAPKMAAYILPDVIFPLRIPTMDTMSALLLAIFLGLGTVWISSERFSSALKDLQTMVLVVVKRILIPILPVFVGTSFALLAISGKLGQMTVFLPAVLIIVCIQFVWIFLVYGVAYLYSKKNSFEVLKHYPQAYFTALGSMSSAATLPVALDCISKSKNVSKETADFALPMFCNIHLCGSVISELFLVVTTYYFFFNQLPSIGSIILLAVLVCVIAIGSPGVPGGINMSCSSLVMTIVLAADAPMMGDQFFAVMTAIYTIQDGFGTACNITCDGALALITETYLKRIENKKNNNK